jgi:hypothetical protein
MHDDKNNGWTATKLTYDGTTNKTCPRDSTRVAEPKPAKNDLLPTGNMAHIQPHQLVEASLEGDIAAIGDLLAGGADVSIADDEGWTPLMASAASGHPEVTRLLLAAGANVDAQDPDGWTALCYACENCNAAVVAELISGEARTDLTTKDGWTALHMACVEGNSYVFGMVFGAALTSESDVLDATTPEVRRTPHARRACIVRLRLTSVLDQSSLSDPILLRLSVARRDGARSCSRRVRATRPS